MKKYRLFSEFCDVEIYGENFIDALKSAGKLPRPKKQDGEKLYGEKIVANLVIQPALIIKSIIGIIDNGGNSCSRGDYPVQSCLVVTDDGQKIAIDGYETDVKIKK